MYKYFCDKCEVEIKAGIIHKYTVEIKYTIDQLGGGNQFMCLCDPCFKDFSSYLGEGYVKDKLKG